MVTETSEIYAKYVRPYMQRYREEGRLNWVFNIIEGKKEQEDVIYREHGDEGFLLLPDLCVIFLINFFLGESRRDLSLTKN